MTTDTATARHLFSVGSRPGNGEVIDIGLARPGASVSPRRPLGDHRPAVLLVAGYLLTMPLLAGLPRGLGLPLLRPSEAVQLVVTVAAVTLVLRSMVAGRRWRIRLGPTEWWLMAMVVTASVAPLLWLAARGHDLGADHLVAAFPMVKYAALYLVVRATITDDDETSLVLAAVSVSGVIVAALAIAQGVGVGPVVDVLGRYYVSSAEDAASIAAGGRGTTTLGSSIATGAFLTIVAALAMARGLDREAAGGRAGAPYRWFALAGFLAVGALASGQAGTVIALAVVGATLAAQYGQFRNLIRLTAPAAVVVAIALWPVITARLADIDPASGLPSSWVIRWSNITDLYWPSLRDGGWVLGVSPDATATPPDIWREVVYLESGYLWLLWVGGVPLLVAAIGFVIAAARRSARHEPSTPIGRAVGRTGVAAAAMLAVVSLFDPHLTLRGGADLLFVVFALGGTALPFVTEAADRPGRWRELLGPATITGARRRARIQIAELPAPPAVVRFGHVDHRPATTLALTVVVDGAAAATAELSLIDDRGALRGVLIASAMGRDPVAVALAWRGLVICARSLRLASLHWSDGGISSSVAAQRADRRELSLAAARVRRLERLRRSRAGRPPARTGEPGVGSTTHPTGIRLTTTPTVPAWKRAVDVTVAVVALIAAAPLWIACAVAVRRSSPGPALFRQVRIGAGGLPFQMYKFRTMYVDNDDRAHREQNRREILEGAEAVKDGDDPRITGAGRILRRLSLDELPQLLNVIRGEMSLVGPRPSLIWEVELFEPPLRRRLTVRPGVTGLWQVSGRGDLSMAEMAELDLRYVDQLGPAVDVRCLAGTAAAVFRREGAR